LAKEAKMKKNGFLMGILSMVLVFGMALFVGCSDGDDTTNGGGENSGDNGGGGSGLTAVSGEFNAFVIKVHCNADFSVTIADGKAGVTVKKNGTSIEFGTVYISSKTDYIGINFLRNEPLPSATDTITVSYDGTSGAFAGKVKAFTDFPVTWKE
jgi:hypothetical protein